MCPVCSAIRESRVASGVCVNHSDLTTSFGKISFRTLLMGHLVTGSKSMKIDKMLDAIAEQAASSMTFLCSKEAVALRCWGQMPWVDSDLGKCFLRTWCWLHPIFDQPAPVQRPYDIPCAEGQICRLATWWINNSIQLIDFYREMCSARDDMPIRRNVIINIQ